MPWKALCWLGLATLGILIAGAGIAQERGEDPDQDESRTRTTTEEPETTREAPAAQPDGSQPVAAGTNAPQAARREPTGQQATAPAPAGGPLKRIDTTPLSANANIALPQDI